MSRYDNAVDLAGKISWEGGIVDLILNYGLKEADLPPDLPAEIRVALVHAIDYLASAAPHLDVIDEWVEETFEESE